MNNVEEELKSRLKNELLKSKVEEQQNYNKMRIEIRIKCKIRHVIMAYQIFMAIDTIPNMQ